MAADGAAIQFGPAKKLSGDSKGGKEPPQVDAAKTSRYADVIGLGFVGVGVGPAHTEGRHVTRTNYLLPFEIVSVHLLVVLVGAAYLARSKKRKA